MSEDYRFETAAVDRFRSRRVLALTLEQRQQMGEELIRHSMELLRASPSGYEAFISRNFRQRCHRPDMQR